MTTKTHAGTAGKAAALPETLPPVYRPTCALSVQPIASLTEQELCELLKAHGMYPPEPTYRQGPAAFTVRHDLSLCDVLDSVGGLLCQAHGVASLMYGDADLEQRAINAASAIAAMLEQARGLHALIWEAIKQLEPSQSKVTTG